LKTTLKEEEERKFEKPGDRNRSKGLNLAADNSDA
jgi:hypothetical protein